jgi:Mg/Co/Ni transporter MgtE
MTLSPAATTEVSSNNTEIMEAAVFQKVGAREAAVGTSAADADAVAMHSASTLRRVRLRMPAILITFAIEMVVAFVISRYEDTLKIYPLLVAFVPVLSAISGNVGLQSSAIVVRNLALGIDSEKKVWRTMLPELKAGAVMASSMTVVVGTTALFWYAPVPGGDDTWSGAAVFALTIGLGTFVSMLISALSGTAAPLLSKRFGFDPSAMAGPMETAFQDIAGSTFLLAMGAFLLNRFGDRGVACPGGDAGACLELCRLAVGVATSAPYDPQCIRSCVADIAAGTC